MLSFLNISVTQRAVDH